MKEYFTTYEISLKLKELGFDEIPRFGHEASLYDNVGNHVFYTNYGFMYSGIGGGYISAPLWQQAIEWLANKYDIHISITVDPYSTIKEVYGYKIYDGNQNLQCILSKDDKHYTLYDAYKNSILDVIAIIKNYNYERKTIHNGSKGTIKSP